MHTDPSSADSRRVLGLFAKQPVVGRVKTRLAADASPSWAARVAEAFLCDLVDLLADFPAQRVLIFDPLEALPYFAELARDRFHLMAQCAGDLGQRMSRFITDELQAGAAAVVIVGTDSPTMPRRFIEQAFAELEQADVVLGPATDGGYYLLGCARRVPPIFDNIPWGGCHVLSATVARLADPQWRLALLPPWYDVDTPQDWQTLQGQLTALRRAGIDPRVPRTERLAIGDLSV